ncbi:MAG: hypothetical protein ABJA35_10705 [Parafilimonas sp.]
MADKKTSNKPKHAKKEFKKKLAGKMESALPEVKLRLGEKKFQRRLKKAAKIFIQGLHDKDFSENGNKETIKIAVKRIKKIKKEKAKKQIATADNLITD